MSMQRIADIIEGYADGLVQSASSQLQGGLADVMAEATENFAIEDNIPHEITAISSGDTVDVSLSVQGAWRRALHENPRFRGYKFLERAWLEHRDDIVQNVRTIINRP